MSLQSDCFQENEKKRGRKSAVQSFPQIIPVVASFVEENGLEANMKKGSERPFLFGTTNKDVQQEILRKVPEVKEKFPKFSISMFRCRALG
jgi:hypothetical protein